MTGGKQNKTRNIISDKYELENNLKHKDLLLSKTKEIENQINEIDYNLKASEDKIYLLNKEKMLKEDEINTKQAKINNLKIELEQITFDISSNNKILNGGLSDEEEEICDIVEVEPNHFKGVNKITGVSDLREGKQITKSVESKIVRTNNTVEGLITQLRQLGMSEEQAQKTVELIVNIFKSRSPQIVEESKEDEDILDNLSTKTIDKVSRIIYNMIQKGWDGDINKVKQY